MSIIGATFLYCPRWISLARERIWVWVGQIKWPGDEICARGVRGQISHVPSKGVGQSVRLLKRPSQSVCCISQSVCCRSQSVCCRSQAKASTVEVKVSASKVRVTARKVRASTKVAKVVPARVATWAKMSGSTSTEPSYWPRSTTSKISRQRSLTRKSVAAAVSLGCVSLSRHLCGESLVTKSSDCITKHLVKPLLEQRPLWLSDHFKDLFGA